MSQFTGTVFTLMLIFSMMLPGSTRAQEVSPAASGERTQYPLTVENCGQTLTFDQAPQRVLATYQNVTEILVALGLADRIVAVNNDLSDTAPPDIASAMASLNYLAPYGGTASIEAQLQTQPDFVFVAYEEYDLDPASGRLTRDDWAKAGASVYAMSAECAENPAPTIEDTYADILTIGRIFDVQSRAEAIVSNMQATIDDVQSRVAGLPPIRVAIYDGGEGPFGFYAGGLYGNLAQLAGGESVFQQDSYVEVNAEDVATSGTELFVIDDYPGAKVPAAERANVLFRTFPELPASRAQRWVPVKDIQFTPGIRNAEAVEEMARAFHPEAFADPLATPAG